MPRKGENIRKRKDGRWERRYKKGVRENGKFNYGSVYGKSYKEVKEKLLHAKHTHLNGDVKINIERMFSEVLFLWIETNRVHLKGSTEQRYDYLIKTHIMPELGGMRLSQISATVINSFLQRKLENGRIDGKGGLSPSYVGSIMIILNSAIGFAVSEKMCPPLSSPIYKPKAEKREVDILSYDEQALIEQYTRNELTSTNIGILISLYTGLRIGEVCALSWEDVDLDNRIIHVRHTVARVKSNVKETGLKTRLIIDEPKIKSSKRDIPIPSTLLPLLVEHKRSALSCFVVSENNGFISPRTYEYRYHRVLNACGMKAINYHALRHTFASRCIEVGVDVKSLSEILGHGNSAITLNTYVHSSLDLKRCQLEKIVSPIAC